MIRDDVEEKVRKRAISDIGMKLEETYFASAQSQLPADSVKEIFTNTALVHSGYMVHDEMIELIASNISRC